MKDTEDGKINVNCETIKPRFLLLSIFSSIYILKTLYSKSLKTSLKTFSFNTVWRSITQLELLVTFLAIKFSIFLFLLQVRIFLRLHCTENLSETQSNMFIFKVIFKSEWKNHLIKLIFINWFTLLCHFYFHSCIFSQMLLVSFLSDNVIVPVLSGEHTS